MSTQSELESKTPNNASASLPTFDFDGLPIRSQVGDTGVPWFNANDICDALGFSNPRQALSTHVTDPEDVQILDTLTPGGAQKVNFVSEFGVYALVMGSTKPGAMRFKRWVYHEVLPAIRKTGSYTTPAGFIDSILRAGDRWLIELERGFNRHEGIEKLMADALKSACDSSPTLRDQK